MVRLVTAAVCSFLVLAASTASAQTATCNPYEMTCPSGPAGPDVNPYVPGGAPGPVVNLGPYAPPTERLAGAAARWVLNGELFLDAGANRFGWLILENLSDQTQDVTIEYASEAWAAPAYRIKSLGPKGRVSVGFHEDPQLRGVYFSARLYCDRSCATHATFRPHAGDTDGQHDVAGVVIPPDSTH